MKQIQRYEEHLKSLSDRLRDAQMPGKRDRVEFLSGDEIKIGYVLRHVATGLVIGTDDYKRHTVHSSLVDVVAYAPARAKEIAKIEAELEELRGMREEIEMTELVSDLLDHVRDTTGIVFLRRW